MKDRDYKEILEKISTPIVVIISNEENSSKKPQSKTDFADNFSIHFVNASFERTYGDLIKVGFSTEECVERLSKEVDWYKMACDASENGELQQATFYSTHCNAWLRVHMNATQSGFIIVSVVNIDKDKEREQQLLRQN